MTTVYIDVLVITNAYISYFLLRATALILRERISVARYLFGSLFGGAASLTLLLPPLDWYLSLLIRLIVAAAAVFIVFGFGGIGGFAIRVLLFAAINGAFAGIMLLLWLFAAPMGMENRNGVTYFDISFPALVICTGLAYFLLRIIRHIVDVRTIAERKYTVVISNRGAEAKLNALADTGNRLTEPFSGLPVIICSGESIRELLPEGFPEDICGATETLPAGVKVITYNTVKGCGVTAAFRPESLIIRSENREKSADALIGVSLSIDGGEYKAIFNPRLFI